MPRVPYASKPENVTPTSNASSASSPKASVARRLTSSLTLVRSASGRTSTSTPQQPSDEAPLRVNAVLFSTLLGMTWSFPRRSRTMVLRQFTSVTKPSNPPTDT